MTIPTNNMDDEDFERRLQETARMSGVPVDRLREMVNAFNAAVFTPPKNEAKAAAPSVEQDADFDAFSDYHTWKGHKA
jgi:hypothetical protein